jgi:elongation factor 1-beta
MGDVIVVFRVMPEDMNNLESIRSELEKLKPQKIEEEPIAFGLKAFRFIKLISEKEGELDKMEGKLSKIKGVQSVEVVELSRSL